MSANPEAAKDETIVLHDAFVPHGRTVPFENGWSWIASAWSIFKRAAGVWIGMIIVLCIIYVVLGIVPIVGAIATIVAAPAFTGGLMLASRTIDQGGEAHFAQLFGGFRHRFGPLVGIGVLYLIGMAVIVLIVGLTTGASVFTVINATTLEEVMAAGAGLMLAALTFLALVTPLLMAVWFAPALVVFHDIGTIAAMKASFVGCVRNMLPFLLYGIVFFIASILASIPAMLGWLILGPVTAASIYTGYRDIYFTS
ncbi:MAG TPA: BPSS1780 family membrane protein [Burkholderiales bacterium]|nr:BPSS1780 family membrane protein [Burkholderiales bacterium]